MALKDFFKFTWSKLIVVGVLFVLNTMIFVLTLFSTMDVTSNASNTMTAIYSITSPFHSIEGLGILFNLILYYLIACIIIFIYNKIKKK
jgi:hypothetical protein